MTPSIGRCVLRVCAIAFLLCTLGGCVTAPAPPESRGGLPAPIREVLPNGMRLIIQEHRAAATVAIHLWVGVGARDEAVGERGFSHFAEHMLFKGTETRPRGFVESDVEAVGGRTNAGTSYDYTFYYLLLPATRTKPGIAPDRGHGDQLRVRSDRAGAGARRRLRGGAAERGQSALLSGAPALRARSTRGIPTGAPSWGTRETCGAPPRRPCAGTTSATTCRRTWRWSWSGPSTRRRSAPPRSRPSARSRAPATRGRRCRRRRRSTACAPGPWSGRSDRRSSASRGWRRRSGIPTCPRWTCSSHILGGSRSSRLNQALREKARLVSGISGWYGALQGAGVVGVTAQLESGDQEAVERGILAEIRRIQADGVTSEELARCDHRLRGPAGVLARDGGRPGPRATAAPRPPGAWRQSAPTWIGCAR